MSQQPLTPCFMEIPQPEMLLLPLGDLHVGSRACDWPRLKKTLKWAEENDAYILGLGDWANLNLKTSKGSVWDDDLRPQEQLDTLYQMFDPFARRGRLIGVIGGNHEARLRRDVDFEFMGLLADKLGVQNFGAQVAIKINQPKSQWQIFATHGSGGGGTTGAKANRFEKYSNLLPMADLVLAGHTHSDVNFQVQCWGFNNKTLTTHTRHHYNTGSFQRYGGYAAAANLQPGPTGCWAITLTQRPHSGAPKTLRAEWLAL